MLLTSSFPNIAVTLSGKAFPLAGADLGFSLGGGGGRNRLCASTHIMNLKPAVPYGRGSGPPLSSVASFLVLGGGGGGQDPEMYRQKIYVLILRASERLRNIHFQDSKYICLHIQSMQFPLITYGRLWRYKHYTDKTLTLRKIFDMRASELRKF